MEISAYKFEMTSAWAMTNPLLRCDNGPEQGKGWIEHAQRLEDWKARK